MMDARVNTVKFKTPLEAQIAHARKINFEMADWYFSGKARCKIILFQPLPSRKPAFFLWAIRFPYTSPTNIEMGHPALPALFLLLGSQYFVHSFFICHMLDSFKHEPPESG